MKKTLLKQWEELIYLVLWVILFGAPIVSAHLRVQTSGQTTVDWHEISYIWRFYLAYFVIFIVHNYFIAPLLVYKNKKGKYFTCIIILFLFFEVYQYLSGPSRKEMMRHKHLHDMEVLARYEGRQKAMELFKRGPINRNRPFPPEGRKGFGGPHDKNIPPLFFGQPYLISSIIVLLLLGMNLGVKFYFKSNKDAEELELMEKQNLRQQLDYLKYQINPHFFMNTLNNIHALVDIDPEKAKTTIVELSKMMRYLLYEGNKPLIPLAVEMQFLQNYVKLMMLRYTNKVSISLDIPDKVPDRGIPPLMMITFSGECLQTWNKLPGKIPFIKVRAVDRRQPVLFHLLITASIKRSTEEHGGVGLVNVRKRLDIIYGEKLYFRYQGYGQYLQGKS
jgi:predicted transcriptional regulator with HTH domain